MVDTDNTAGTQEELDEDDDQFVALLTDKILLVMEVLVGYPLRPYQIPLARRIIESVLIEDAATITALAARQSGKSETLCNTVAVLLVLLPLLARIFPNRLAKFKDGLWVGVFAPVADQAETLYGRIVDRLTSERAVEFLNDPSIDDAVVAKSHLIRFKRNGSRMRMMTANPRAKIESQSFHLVLVDEAQDCFPAETPVLTSRGWVSIGDIVLGEKRDWFVAAQDSNGDVSWSRVRTAFRTPRHTDLVRVDHEYGSLYCTANHPVVVGDARVPARDLVPGAPLSLVQTTDQSPRGDTASPRDHGCLSSIVLAGTCGPPYRGSAAADRSRTMAGREPSGKTESEGVGAHAEAQPDARPEGAREGIGVPARSFPPNEGRQRTWSDGAATAALSELAGLGARICLPYWRASGQGRLADPLQDRPCGPEAEDCGRSGWSLAQSVPQEGCGCAQGVVAVESRVVGVEVLEPGSSEFDLFGDRADQVYCLEVEAESHTFVAGGLLVGNCNDFVIRKSIEPMVAAYAGTVVKTGTPTTRKGDFFAEIRNNKRKALAGGRKDHFEWDWREVAKVSPQYRKTIEKTIERIGEDSDEFQMSFCLKWLLEQGMFTTETRLEELGDTSVQELIKVWTRTPVVVGIDVARMGGDSTVVTVAFVDWDRPDEYGMYAHRVLNWLELQGMPLEQQYYYIVNFLENYNLFAVAVDAQGMGAAVAERLAVLLRHKNCEVIGMSSNAADQNERWKHLTTLMDRGLVGWPAGAKVRRLRVFKRFWQQMVDAEKHYQGPYLVVKAPDENNAHDDFVDSLALATYTTKDLSAPQAEMSTAPWFR